MLCLRLNQFLPALALLIAAGVCAEDRKTDVITLYNGDRVTGEIKSLEKGILQLSTDSMGTLSIEWPDIARIQSDYFYQLRLTDGTRMFGSLLERARPGQVVLVDIFGEHSLESLQVVEIRPIEDSFWERLDVYLSTTFSYTSATDIVQAAFNTDLNYETENAINAFTGRVDYSYSNNEDKSSSRLDLTRSVWSENRGDSFRALFGNYESNEEFNLKGRVGVGAGIGRFFIDTYRAKLSGIAGLQVITEYGQENDSNQEIELLVNSNLSMWNFSSPELDLSLGVTLYPSVTDPGRLRSSSNLRLRWELLDDLFWDVTAWATTDNRSETRENADYSITTGLGWKY